MNALEFLQTIFHACSNEFTYIWTRTNENTVKRTRSFKITDLETLVKVAKKNNLINMHVSFSMGLLDHPLGTYERAKSSDIVAIPCLWCDIDIADAVHGQHQKLVPSVEDAIELLPAELYPSIIVDSGFGIHAYWIFDHLLPTTTDSERSRAKKLLEQMQSVIRHNAGEYFIDPTADLSRMLRLPDTVNWKVPNKKDAPICKVIDASNIVYPIDDLESKLQALIGKLLPKTENPREISISQKDFLNSRGNFSINDSILQESAEKLFENCSFCRCCRDNIATLSHAEFIDFFPNLLKAKDGFDVADSLCKIRFGEKYDQRKTRLHIDSLSELTPITCDRIASLHPSCNKKTCIVKKLGKNSPCAILLSPKVKSSIDSDSIGDILPDTPDSIKNLQMPDGFTISDSCIIDNRGKYSKSIIDTPIIVSREISFANTDKPAFYEISYLKRGIWKKSIVKPTVLSDSKLLVNTLPNDGILISSKQAGYATDFFMAFIRQNESNIPQVNIFDKLGWYKDKFILPSLNNGEYLISDIQSNEKIQRHGDRNSYITLLRQVFQYPYARLLIAANLAAPLLELVNCRNFILDLICRSHQGKSSALLFANSLWGKT